MLHTPQRGVWNSRQLDDTLFLFYKSEHIDKNWTGEGETRALMGVFRKAVLGRPLLTVQKREDLQSDLAHGVLRSADCTIGRDRMDNLRMLLQILISRYGERSHTWSHKETGQLPLQSPRRFPQTQGPHPRQAPTQDPGLGSTASGQTSPTSLLQTKIWCNAIRQQALRTGAQIILQAFLVRHRFLSNSQVSISFSSIPHSALPISPQEPAKMSARGFSQAVRPVARQLTKSAAQRRTFVAAMGAATRATAAVARPALASPMQQQTRGVKTIDFAGVKEDVFGKLRKH